MSRKTCIVLCSGGLDSSTLLLDILENFGYHGVIPIHFEYGQRNFIFERVCVSRLCNSLGLILEKVDLTSVYRSWFHALQLRSLSKLGFEFPFRNLILVACACVVGQSELLLAYGDEMREGKSFDIALAIHKHVTYEEYWDITPEFLNGLRKFLKKSPYNVRLVAPYVNWEKSQIVERARILDFALPRKTATCYSPRYSKAGDYFVISPCGICESCVERGFGVDFDINEYSIRFTYKEAIDYGISPRTLQQVFLD